MEREGVIKFALHHTQGDAGPANHELEDLLGWRAVFFDLGWIGQVTHRYDGLGFGNVSVRASPGVPPRGARPFWVSATQSSGEGSVNFRHFSKVFRWDLKRHAIWSIGEMHPSSESITHALIYDLAPHARCVIHTHDPVLWRCAMKLGLPTTPPHVAYGTAEMALAVAKLFEHPSIERGIFSMLGHEDGVVAFGRSPGEAAQRLLAAHAKARTMETP